MTAQRPFDVVNDALPHRLLLLCDHASNVLPSSYGTLGLGAADMQRHIAYDIGAAALTRGLAARLGVPAILSWYSRLLIDLNRGSDDPTLIMRLSDGSVVPGNALIDAAEREQRIRRYHEPYHNAVSRLLDAAKRDGASPALLSVHSFTPVWRGIPRPWHAGVMSASDRRLAEPLLLGLRAAGDVVVGDNEPYSGALKNDTLRRHGAGRGLASAGLEVRQDLLGDEGGVGDWVDRLARVLKQIL